MSGVLARRLTRTCLVTAIAAGLAIAARAASVQAAGPLVFQDQADGGLDIFTMNRDGANRKNLTNSPGADSFASPSPNGRQILFQSSRDGNDEIYVMNADGSGQRRLTNHPGADRFPVQCSNGSIVFQTNRFGTDFDIASMNSNGSKVRGLTNDATTESQPACAPDGNRFAYMSNRTNNFEIFENVLTAKRRRAPRNLTRSPAGDADPAYSPNGAELAIASNRDGNLDLYGLPLRQARGTGPVSLRTITSTTGVQNRAPAFDPASGELYATLIDAPGDRIQRIARSGQTTIIGNGSYASVRPQIRCVVNGDKLVVLGTLGPDRIRVTSTQDGAVQVYDDAGIPRVLLCHVSNVRSIEVHGLAGDDRITATDLQLPVEANGGEGNDHIRLGGGDDTARGGPGNDQISGGGGNDRLFGDEGRDNLSGGRGEDQLFGGTGRDKCAGGAGLDAILVRGKNRCERYS